MRCTGFSHELPRIVLADGGFLIGRLHEAGERVVAVVLVAVHDEQVARRFANADADDVLAVLLQLDDEAREVGVAGEQDERADLGRVNTSSSASIARRMSVAFFFEDRRPARRSDRSTIRQRHDVLRIASPVGVGALDGDLSLDDLRREEASSSFPRSERIPS
jgi:hypothetical protein